jgi:single-strand DNA-binding protein
MSAQVAAYGRLGADPVQRQSQGGKVWATASIAVALAEDNDTPPQWFGVVAFGRTAEILCRHAKGDLVSVSGRLQLNRYRDRDGNEREQMQVLANTVISARTVRSSGGQKRGGGHA